MAASLLPLDALPRLTSDRVVQNWDNFVLEIKEQGALAVGDASSVDLVVLSPAAYQKVLDQLARLEAIDDAGITELKARLEEQVKAMQAPDSRERIDKLMAARGQWTNKPPIVGSF